MKKIASVCLLLNTFFVAAQSLTTSLTACYSLDGNANDPINSLNGTLGSAVTLTVNRFNNPNSAYSFNGTSSSYIELPNTPLLKPADAISFSVWLKPNLNPGSHIIYTKNNQNSNFEAFMLCAYINSPVFRINKANATNNNVVLSTTTITPGTWYHVVGTIDNTSLNLYINGVLEGTTASTFSGFDYQIGKKVFLGDSQESYSVPYNGSMDNLRFYNRTLTAAEVVQLYNSDPTCISQPGEAINCDGVNDYIDPNVVVTTFTNNFTIESWVRPTATIAAVTQSNSGIPGLSGQRYLLWPTWRNGDGGIGISVGTNGVQVYEHGSNFMPALLAWTGTITAWTHIAVVVTNKQPALYINGTLVQTGLTSTKTNVWASLGAAGQFPGQIGGIGGGTYGYYQGDIDEFRLWNGVRTQSQISANMNVEFVNCNPPGLFAYYKFNQGIASANNSTVNFATDFSGNSYTGALTNYTLIGNTSNWISPGASLTPGGIINITASVSPTSVICSGQNATLTAGGANTYTWLPGSLSGSVITVNPLSTTIYTVIGSNGVCSGSTAVTVSVSAPSLSISAGQTTLCQGNSTILTATNTLTYTWQPGNLSGSTITVTPGSTIIYTVSGTNSLGCTSSSTLLLTVNLNPVISIIPSSTLVCAGSSVSLTAGGGTSYSWSPGSLSGSLVIVNPSLSTTYTVTGTLNGCTGTNVAVVLVNTLPSMFAASNTPTVCSGGSVSLVSGGALTYTWQPGAINTQSITTTLLNTTIFTVTGTNSNGCSNTATVLVAVIPKPNVAAAAVPSVVCAGGNSTLVATGASNYTWQPINVFTNFTIVSSLINNTGYTLTGETAGCTNSAMVTVTVNPKPTLITNSPVSTCSGSVAVLSASGAVNYTWIPGNQIGSSITIVPNQNIFYTVTGMNSFGCTSSTLVGVNVFPLPSVTVTSPKNPVCLGEAVNLSAFGAISYTWFPGSFNTPIISVSPTASTVYSLSGSNAFGCVSTSLYSLSVNSPGTIIATASSNSICAGNTASIQLSGSSNYSWNPSSSLSTTLGPFVLANPLITTVYTVTAFNSVCSTSALVTISVSPNPTISILAESFSVCSGSSVTFTASGASSYSWLPFNQNGSVITITATATTNYTLLGSSSAGCVSTTLGSIGVQSSPVIILSQSASSVCAGESVTCTAQGASNYSWIPTGTTGNSVVLSPSVSVNYTLLGSNNGCTGSFTFSINVSNCTNNRFFGLTNAADKPIPFNSNYYRINFTVIAANTSSINLQNVRLNTDLKSTFPYPCSYSVISTPVIKSVNSALQANGNFDGDVNASLTKSQTSVLLSNKRDTLVYSVLVEPKGFYGPIKNSVIGFATLPDNSVVSDTSNNGFIWDPDKDGDPTNNNAATLIDIAAIDLFIPEGFSPNDDGNNDLFSIKGLNEKGAKLIIYNRWGNKVFVKEGTELSWDGKANVNSVKFGNDKLPTGTYFYTLEFPESNTPNRNGFVVLWY